MCVLLLYNIYINIHEHQPKLHIPAWHSMAHGFNWCVKRRRGDDSKLSSVAHRGVKTNGMSFPKMWQCVKTLVPLVNLKIAGKWMFIPLKMVLIGIDPYPCGCTCEIRRVSARDLYRSLQYVRKFWAEKLLQWPWLNYPSLGQLNKDSQIRPKVAVFKQNAYTKLYKHAYQCVCMWV